MRAEREGNRMAQTYRAPKSVCICGIVLVTVALSGAARAGNRETVLYSFKGGSDGSNPVAGLIADKAGDLFGTTYQGGAGNDGTVFELSADGTETVLYAFQGGKHDGAYPYAGLIADSSGNLYGTTVQGGIDRCYYNGPISCGTVFKLAPDGSETVLHYFPGKEAPYGKVRDGTNPHGSLLLDQSGNLYGTTFGGGHGVGTVFEVAAGGTESVVYAFKGDGDPIAGLIADNAGNRYGTTQYGGSFACDFGCGTVYEVAADGTEKTLYSFAGGSDGAHPVAGLTVDAAGNLYGTTLSGGGTGCGGSGCGTVFRLAPDKTETVLYGFCAQANCTDGAAPMGAPVEDAAGNFYGTTSSGGSSNDGTVFRVAADGTETVLHSFMGGSDGTDPMSNLIVGKGGDLFGTTNGGGASGAGTVFRIKP